MIIQLYCHQTTSFLSIFIHYSKLTRLSASFGGSFVIHFYKDNDDNFNEPIILIYKMISLAIDNSNYMLTTYGGHYLNPQIYSDI